MNARAHDPLEQLCVETAEVVRLRGILVAREESDAHCWGKEDEQRSGVDGVRCDRYDLRVRVAVLAGRVDELFHQSAGANGSRDVRTDEDGRRVRCGMDEGPFGSDRVPQYPGGPYGGGSRSR